MLTESKRSHVIVLEDVSLKRFKVLSLYEKFCDLCLNSHCMKVRNESVAHVGLSLEFPFANTQVLSRTNPEKLIKGTL